MANKKFYVVWEGRFKGIFNNWDDCKKAVHGFNGAKYKGFTDRNSAEAAWKNGFQYAKVDSPLKMPIINAKTEPPLEEYIAVDAACSGNPGAMEYRGVISSTGQEVFHSGIYALGTNNIGEFLAIVHALAWQQKKLLTLAVYSDSVNAINWVFDGKARTKLARNDKNNTLFEHISRAETWLKNNRIQVPVLKWETKNWGEIPADFGRK